MENFHICGLCFRSVNDRVHSTDVLTALSSGSPLHKVGSLLGFVLKFVVRIDGEFMN